MRKLSVGIAIAAVMLACMSAYGQNNNNAVIIQAYLPENADQLDWAPEGEDTLDELWNDCFLMYELFYNRPAIGGDTGKIHMLWGEGSDYWRTGWRYDPSGQLGVHEITDDSACITTVENTFNALSGQMTEADSLFCYTWGHGGHNGGDFPKRATHFNIKVRPIGQDRGTPL